MPPGTPGSKPASLITLSMNLRGPVTLFAHFILSQVGGSEVDSDVGVYRTTMLTTTTVGVRRKKIEWRDRPRKRRKGLRSGEVQHPMPNADAPPPNIMVYPAWPTRGPTTFQKMGSHIQKLDNRVYIIRGLRDLLAASCFLAFILSLWTV